MIHFFHEAGAEAAAPETIQEVVLEQCRCWYHLRSLMRQWSEQFEDYEQTLMRIDWQSQRNRNFLQVKFDQIKTKIENDTKDGSIFADCSGCGFPAAELHEQSHILKDVICRVCGLDRGYLEIACPANCGGTIHIEADHGSERTCQKCNHVVETDELLAVLDT